ncbi:MAG: QueT transporter family protein [Pygmaiobacter massiliensis]|nr:QueT transporter family protein [Pygmaiobacter massiliensis]
MNNTQRSNTQKLVRGAMIAAVYTAVSLALAPLSFSAVQVRFAEALCLLPVLCPEAVWGVTLGCLLTNLLGSVPLDAVFGTLATLIAALAAYKLRHLRWKGLPLAAAFCPVVVNAVIVGAEITFFFMDGPATGAILAMNMFTVGLGEVISCVVLGCALVRLIEKNGALLQLFGKLQADR